MRILPRLVATSLSGFAIAPKPMRLTLDAPIDNWDEAIYGCSGTAWGTEFGDYRTVDGKRKFVPAPANWRCTTKPGKVYIHVLNWPKDGKLELPALKGKITKAYLQADPSTRVQVNQTSERVLLTVPQNAPDAIASVVCLNL